jgi:hypothetical protein
MVIAFDVLRERRLQSGYRRFIAGSIGMAAALFVASSAVSGVGSYAAFVRHISLHKDTPLTNNMGLEMLATHDWDGRMAFTIDERLDDSVRDWKAGYSSRAHALRPMLVAVALLHLVWTARVLRRGQRLWVGLALGVPLSMSVLNLTCYYYSWFVAPAVLVRLSPALGPAYLALAAASQVVLTRLYWIDDQYAALSLLFYAFALSTLYALSRPVRVPGADARSR